MKYFKGIKGTLTAILAIILISSLLLINGCAKKEPETIKIGAILPLTGNLAFLGQSEEMALRVAVEDINNSGGIMGKRVELFIEDSKGKPKEGVSVAHKLLDINKVQLGLVSTSTISNAVTPVFSEKEIPLIVIASDETIPNRYSNAIKIYVSMDSEQKVMSRYLIKEGVKKLSIIRVNAQITEHAITLLKKFTSGNIKIVTDLPYDMKGANFKSIATKVKSDNSEAIYVIGYGFEFPALIKALKEMEVTKKIYGNYMFLVDPARNEGTKLYEGIEFTSFNLTPEDLIKTDLGKKFQNITGKNPGPFMDYLYVYDSVQIWANTLRNGIAPKSFSSYIRGKSFPSSLGKIMIDNSGNAINEMAIATYDKDGSVRIIWKEGQ